MFNEPKGSPIVQPRANQIRNSNQTKCKKILEHVCIRDDCENEATTISLPRMFIAVIELVSHHGFAVAQTELLALSMLA